ncbi:hypothetical protein EV356DRAFT_503166 [Viridothelium virens]|uniref:Uncharacterized protein n=1 Tax=Viridothelium virens TaxID=1048519 RepID=A0A6A6H6F9_VIRVR|nr:hypothetical protein EV356DRAFT_503166 [Viridothelium virens]
MFHRTCRVDGSDRVASSLRRGGPSSLKLFALRIGKGNTVSVIYSMAAIYYYSTLTCIITSSYSKSSGSSIMHRRKE